MIPDSLIKLAVSVVMAAALTEQLPRLVYEVRIAELKLLKESQASNWGNPSIFQYAPASTRHAGPPRLSGVQIHR